MATSIKMQIARKCGFDDEAEKTHISNLFQQPSDISRFNAWRKFCSKVIPLRRDRDPAGYVPLVGVNGKDKLDIYTEDSFSGRRGFSPAIPVVTLYSNGSKVVRGVPIGQNVSVTEPLYDLTGGIQFSSRPSDNRMQPCVAEICRRGHRAFHLAVGQELHLDSQHRLTQPYESKKIRVDRKLSYGVTNRLTEMAHNIGGVYQFIASATGYTNPSEQINMLVDNYVEQFGRPSKESIPMNRFCARYNADPVIASSVLWPEFYWSSGVGSMLEGNAHQLAIKLIHDMYFDFEQITPTNVQMIAMLSQMSNRFDSISYFSTLVCRLRTGINRFDLRSCMDSFDYYAQQIRPVVLWLKGAYYVDTQYIYE